MQTAKRIKAFRISYLICSLCIAAFGIYVLALCLIDGINNGVTFDLTINAVSVTVCVLFEVAIIFFIIRSLRTHLTLLMKNLVFKQDGSPYPFGIIASAVGSVLFIAATILLFVAPALNWLDAMTTPMRLFIADVTLTMAANLGFTQAYFWCFRRESGTFEII